MFATCLGPGQTVRFPVVPTTVAPMGSVSASLRGLASVKMDLRAKIVHSASAQAGAQGMANAILSLGSALANLRGLKMTARSLPVQITAVRMVCAPKKKLVHMRQEGVFATLGGRGRLAASASAREIARVMVFATLLREHVLAIRCIQAKIAARVCVSTTVLTRTEFAMTRVCVNATHLGMERTARLHFAQIIVQIMGHVCKRLKMRASVFARNHGLQQTVQWLVVPMIAAGMGSVYKLTRQVYVLAMTRGQIRIVPSPNAL